MPNTPLPSLVTEEEINEALRPLASLIIQRIHRYLVEAAQVQAAVLKAEAAQAAAAVPKAEAAPANGALADLSLLTADELAKKMQIKLRTVRAWTADGLPNIPAGRLRRYLLSECISWLRDREAQKQTKERELQRRTAGLHVASS